MSTRGTLEQFSSLYKYHWKIYKLRSLTYVSVYTSYEGANVTWSCPRNIRRVTRRSSYYQNLMLTINFALCKSTLRQTKKNHQVEIFIVNCNINPTVKDAHARSCVHKHFYDKRRGSSFISEYSVVVVVNIFPFPLPPLPALFLCPLPLQNIDAILVIQGKKLSMQSF